MPFVVFKNSEGSGFVVPDGHGGTKLKYLRRKALDEAFETLDRVSEDREIVVEHVNVDRVVQVS
jgi:hypothetical protein